MGNHLSHSNYLNKIFQPENLIETTNKVIRKLEELKAGGLKFDAIAFSGNSGAGIGFPVSCMTGLPILLVRKGEPSHGCEVEATYGEFKNYIILDDLIASGSTVRRIVDKLDQYDCECVGIILYDLSGRSNNFRGISIHYLD